MSDRYSTCTRCKGEGAYWTTLKRSATDIGREAYVSCEQVGCHNGTVDREAYLHAMGCESAYVCCNQENNQCG